MNRIVYGFLRQRAFSAYFYNSSGTALEGLTQTKELNYMSSKIGLEKTNKQKKKKPKNEIIG